MEQPLSSPPRQRTLAEVGLRIAVAGHIEVDRSFDLEEAAGNTRERHQ